MEISFERIVAVSDSWECYSGHVQVVSKRKMLVFKGVAGIDGLSQKYKTFRGFDGVWFATASRGTFRDSPDIGIYGRYCDIYGRHGQFVAADCSSACRESRIKPEMIIISVSDVLDCHLGTFSVVGHTIVCHRRCS